MPLKNGQNFSVCYIINLETAIELNRETRQPREREGWEGCAPHQKCFPQWVIGSRSQSGGTLAHFADFTVSTAVSRIELVFDGGVGMGVSFIHVPGIR